MQKPKPPDKRKTLYQAQKRLKNLIAQSRKAIDHYTAKLAEVERELAEQE